MQNHTHRAYPDGILDPSSRRRHHVNPQPNPDDPALREAVTTILNDRINEVVTHIGAQLDQAGHTEAAEFVRRNFGTEQ